MVDNLTAYIIAGLVLFAVPVMIIAFMQAGFFWYWIRARGGRGRVVLIKARGPLRDYFRTGIVDDAFLVFKDENKEKKRISITNDAVYRCWNVPCVDYDSETNAFKDHEYKEVSGFNAIAFEHLYERAQYRPTLQDNKTMIIIILICLAVLISLGGIYFTYTVKQQLAELAPQIAQIAKNTAPELIKGVV